MITENTIVVCLQDGAWVKKDHIYVVKSLDGTQADVHEGTGLMNVSIENLRAATTEEIADALYRANRTT